MNLTKLNNFNGRKGPLLLIIMDGVGIGKEYDGNAVFKAHTPVLDKLFASELYTQLKAHGPAVGLPSEDDMGNSEVGHNAIGAGRKFDQGAKLVNNSIRSGAIFDSEIWNKIISRNLNGGTVHFMGLLSDGNVHSHIDQLISLITKCAEQGIKKVRLHALLDGRDVPGRSGLLYIEKMEKLFADLNTKYSCDFSFGSGGGRMKVTMDRYNADWSIVQRGWDAHVRGIGRPFISATDAVQTFYNEDPEIIDQYLDPFIIVDNNNQPLGKILDGDSVIMFNFRGDRAIEISRAFGEKDFSEFDRVVIPDVLYAGMMEYDGDLHIPNNYLVSPPAIERTMSEYLCNEKVPSFAISETQKYGHVTYFWNGNRSGYLNRDLETYVEIPSDKIVFDKAPKMKALEITEETIRLLQSGKFRFGRVNFANGDMVGHTGTFEAAVTAVETVDTCVGKLLSEVEKLEGIAIVTADHGNADEMFTVKNGVKSVKTAHTLNPVPFVICDFGYKGEYNMTHIPDAGLTNIAATVLNLLGYEKVADYDDSLISFVK